MPHFLNSLIRHLGYRIERVSVEKQETTEQATSYTNKNIYTSNYDYDGLSIDPQKIHNHDFLLDDKYVRSYKKASETVSESPNKKYWTTHVALWCASVAEKLEGDFVECGVWRGFYTTAILNYINWPMPERHFYLFDSWEGLDNEQLNKNEKQQIGKINYLNKFYADQFDQVNNHFSTYKNVKLIKGMIPKTLENVEINKVCYLSLDMNCAAPEIAAANFFWDKIISGGVILLDDYGLVQYEEQKVAFDIFAKEKDVTILALPTGQGIIIKP
ncbi:polysaccharide deacetylase [Alteromonadaceae bacterium M269]|nr:polysaccharide deacetylase [Alteromonadaceae bacterium M269]